MSQAYPQFTPVQILEAGQRAYSEGRTDYAAQFFQHLIEHYGDTAEAAAARDAMAQINTGQVNTTQGNVAPSNGQSHTPNTERSQGQPVYRNGAAPAAAPSSFTAHPPVYASTATASGARRGHQLSMNGANGNHHEHVAPNGAYNGAGSAQLNGRTNGVDGNAGGYGSALSARDELDHRSASAAVHRQHEPSLGQASASDSPLSQAPASYPGSLDVPRHMRRDGDTARARPAAASHRLLVPAPEKNYIIGRVIAGLLLLIGIIGILAGIMLVYVALTDPRLFTAVGIATSGQAIMFAGSVFVGSVAALIASQMATAIFDGADAVSDLARLERYRFGESDDE